MRKLMIMDYAPIVYVEDCEDDVFFMRIALEEAGVPNPFVSIADGGEALRYLGGEGEFADRNKHPLPCLLFLDLKLPVKSGFDVLQWIREHPVLRSLKVVVLSASNQQLDIDLARQLGISDYIIKPSVPSRLIQIVCERKQSWLSDGAPSSIRPMSKSAGSASTVGGVVPRDPA